MPGKPWTACSNACRPARDASAAIAAVAALREAVQAGHGPLQSIHQAIYAHWR